MEEVMAEQKNPAEEIGARERILVARPSSTLSSITESYTGYISSKTTSIKYTSVPRPPENKRRTFLAQCDELFCVLVGHQLFLWNPSTNASKQLPPPPIYILRVNSLIYGLGYDSISNDYKLLLIPCGKAKNKETELYSLKNNSWRKIPSFHQSKYSVCVYMNGALHWVDSVAVVVSFNLSTEERVELAAPKYDSNPDIVQVSVLKGKLCVTQTYRGVKFVLWLMEVYGIDTSWWKTVEIDYNKSLCHDYLRWQIRPIYLYDNGDILVIVLASGRAGKHDDDHLGAYIYKREQGTLKKLLGPRGKEVGSAFIYVESQVIVERKLNQLLSMLKV